MPGGDHPRDLELAVVNAAIWGLDTNSHLDELASVEFLDPWCRDVATVLVDLWAEIEPGSKRVEPLAVAEAVERLGWRPTTSPSIFLAEVTAAGYSIHALPLYLSQLREVAQRRHLLARLVALADTLERPGGPARVAAVLGVEVMA